MDDMQGVIVIAVIVAVYGAFGCMLDWLKLPAREKVGYMCFAVIMPLMLTLGILGVLIDAVFFLPLLVVQIMRSLKVGAEKLEDS